jgi:hypothetical protein
MVKENLATQPAPSFKEKTSVGIYDDFTRMAPRNLKERGRLEPSEANEIGFSST